MPYDRKLLSSLSPSDLPLAAVSKPSYIYYFVVRKQVPAMQSMKKNVPYVILGRRKQETPEMIDAEVGTRKIH